MLYHLLYPLADQFQAFNLFRYSPSAPPARC
jgi:hypothetical protein